MNPAGGGRPWVIGLVGGVGAGKSAVAAAFRSLGCVVSDSDAHARQALARPDVQATLESWWGRDVVLAAGGVDRARIAALIFADPAQRARLEGLVHPIIHRARRDDLLRAGAAGAPALIVDAPLLLEAGVAAECDAVVFVDAPRADRLARVVASRGWDEAEFDRREAAQWPLERKRGASQFVIGNEGRRADLAEQARGVLEALALRTGRPHPA